MDPADPFLHAGVAFQGRYSVESLSEFFVGKEPMDLVATGVADVDGLGAAFAAGDKVMFFRVAVGGESATERALDPGRFHGLAYTVVLASPNGMR